MVTQFWGGRSHRKRCGFHGKLVIDRQPPYENQKWLCCRQFRKCAQVCSRLGVPRNSWNGWSLKYRKNLWESPSPHAMHPPPLGSSFFGKLEFTKSTESITNVGSHIYWFLLFLGHHSIKRLKSNGGNPKRNQRCNQRGHRCLVWKIAVKVQICELRTICGWTWSKF